MRDIFCVLHNDLVTFYETRQSSLLYVFGLFFGLDRAQNTIVFLLRVEEITNRNVLVT